jgi:serine/threonine protein kinase
MCENKEKKLIELHKRQIEHCTLPISTISVNGILYGYEMNFEEYFKTYNLYEISADKDVLLYFLKETRKILDYFKNNNIIYGDMDPRNILFNINTGETIFCDMDNIQIDDYQMDKIPCSLGDYLIFPEDELDFGVHPFMHNKMLLRSLNTDLYFITAKERRCYFDRHAKKIIEGMKDPEFFDNEYLIDHIKKLNR